MVPCVVTTAYLKTFIHSRQGDITALTEANLDHARELLEIVQSGHGSRRTTLLRSFYLIEAIATRPRAVLDPVVGATWPRSRSGLNTLLDLVTDRRDELKARDAEAILGGLADRVLGDYMREQREHDYRITEVLEGCATQLRRALLSSNGSWVNLGRVGSLGVGAFELYNTAHETVKLAQEMMTITEEDNRRAWDPQT